MSVVELKVAPKKNSGEKLLEQYDKNNAEFREWLVNHPDGGYCMIAYERMTDGGMRSIANYWLADPMDAYSFPDFAKGRLEDVRHDEQFFTKE